MINQGNAKFTVKLLKEMLRFLYISCLIFHCIIAAKKIIRYFSFLVKGKRGTRKKTVKEE